MSIQPLEAHKGYAQARADLARLQDEHTEAGQAVQAAAQVLQETKHAALDPDTGRTWQDVNDAQQDYDRAEFYASKLQADIDGQQEWVQAQHRAAVDAQGEDLQAASVAAVERMIRGYEELLAGYADRQAALGAVDGSQRHRGMHDVFPDPSTGTVGAFIAPTWHRNAQAWLDKTRKRSA